MAAPVVEPATIADLEALTDLLAELFEREADFHPDPQKQMRALRMILESPSRGRIFVLRQHDRILGMINLLFTISTAEGGGALLLEDLIIQRDYRHQGLGKRLIEFAVDYARQKGFLRITLLTDRDDQQTIDFYMSHGFFASEMLPLRMLLRAPERNPTP